MVIDNFAGAGGASMGIEAAIGRSVDIAVNHDARSVSMHQINHPNTRHLCEDVWDVDPHQATAGRAVGLAWFSPDCRHFSRAKGGKPVEKNIRGLAWVVIRWAKAVKPRVIILENVREFVEWGPLTCDSRPCAKRKGQTFRRWRSTLENLGYRVEHRILNAADFGAPTHRRRFFLIARCDSQPISWPEPTHGPGRRPYRTAAECIDWTIPCPSIFLTKEESRPLRIIRPLAEKTMRRIAMGLKRYVLENPKPFIVTCNHSGEEFRGHGIDEPFKTLTAARDAHGLVTPFIARCAHGDEGKNGSKRWGKGAHEVQEPLPTLTGSKDFAVTAPYVVRTDHHQSHATNAFDARQPIGTITSAAGHAVVSPILIGTGGPARSGEPRPVDAPIGAVMPKSCRAVVAPFLASNYGEAPRQETRGQRADEPLRTVTPQNNTGMLIAPHLLKLKGNQGAGMHGADPAAPLPTICAGATTFGVVAPMLVGTGGPDYSGKPKAADEPIGTLMTDNRRSLVSAFLAKHYGGVVGHGPERPLGTITAVDHHSVVSSNLIHLNHGDKTWNAVDEPLRTITAGGNHVAEVRAFLMRYYSSGGQVSAVDAPSPTVTTKDRLGVVTVHGQEYQIMDIGLRMLTPRELLRAQFGKYAKDYVLTGTKSQQVARIGNSVPPELAEAVVRANFAEEVEVAA